MINFGLIDEWEPSGGAVTSWSASSASVAGANKAPVHPVPPSHQQEEYLRTAHRNEDAGFRFSRLCLIAFDIQGDLDRDAMTRAINAFVARHDTFLSWFSLEDDARMHRHVIDPDVIDFVWQEHGHIDTGEDIRTLVQHLTPGPFNWDCFTFGVVERDGHFTVFFAVDHLNSDGISQALACVDILTLYTKEASGDATPLDPAGSYIDYCRRERESSAELTEADPRVQNWLTILKNNGGRLPSFPLSLGTERDQYTRSALLTVEIFDEQAAKKVEKVCRAHKGDFNAAVLAIAGLATRALGGPKSFFALTPKSTRVTRSEFRAVGWFTSLIPVVVDIAENATFTDVVTPVRASYKEGRELSDVSLHRVLQLVKDESSLEIEPGWVVPMVSFIDVRRLPGGAMFDDMNAGVFGNRGSSEEVYMWVNRFPTYTAMTLLYPDTAVAERSIKTYADHICSIFGEIASTGDFTLDARA